MGRMGNPLEAIRMFNSSPTPHQINILYTFPADAGSFGLCRRRGSDQLAIFNWFSCIMGLFIFI